MRFPETRRRGNLVTLRFPKADYPKTVFFLRLLSLLNCSLELLDLHLQSGTTKQEFQTKFKGWIAFSSVLSL